jgi:Xaa-Pro aminopeptidase
MGTVECGTDPLDSYSGVMHLDRLVTELGGSGIDVLLVSPGPDLRYLIGYDAVPLERLTLLVARAEGEATLFVPGLERSEAERTPFARAGGRVVSWGETDDPWALVRSAVGSPRSIGLDPQMWASRVLRVQAEWPDATVAAPPVVAELRSVKGDDEIRALQEAGEAIDRVHRRIPGFLRVGRTEREVAGDIADAILDEGHSRVDFVIVASGPNGASPHHSVSDRVIERGDPIVIDIGGTMPSGYCSDCTRVYVIGDAPVEYVEHYSALLEAQERAVAAVAPGVTCEAIDAVARTHLTEAGLGEAFIHRTGHGIGLETHEDPYIVTGNAMALGPGMAFSVEPGFYLEGRFGARIEDIVVCVDRGAVRLNTVSRDLCVI